MMQATLPTHIPSPSQLWAFTAHVSAEGTPAEHADTCVLCGASIAPGDLCEPVGPTRIGESFNNKIDAKFKGDSLCGHCVALWSAEWMQRKSKSYAVQGQGIYALASAADMAGFILRPPEAPYVAIHNSRQQQHLIWRTPVALPSNWLQIRVDDEIVVIDRQKVIDAVPAWRAALAILRKTGVPRGTPIIIGGGLLNVNLGSTIPRFAEAVEKHSEEGRQAMATLRDLALPECWALWALTSEKLAADLPGFSVEDPATWPQRREFES